MYVFNTIHTKSCALFFKKSFFINIKYKKIMDKKLYLICSVEYCFNMPSLFAMDSDGKYYGDDCYPKLRNYPKDVDYWRTATSSDSDRRFYVVRCSGIEADQFTGQFMDLTENWEYMNAKQRRIAAAEYHLTFLSILNRFYWNQQERDAAELMIKYLMEYNFEFFQVFRNLKKNEREKLIKCNKTEYEEACGILNMDLFSAATINGINEHDYYDNHEDDYDFYD